jgi:hypothetical protein
VCHSDRKGRPPTWNTGSQNRAASSGISAQHSSSTPRSASGASSSTAGTPSSPTAPASRKRSAMKFARYTCRPASDATRSRARMPVEPRSATAVPTVIRLMA